MNRWKLSDFLTNDDFMNDRIADILINRHETDGGQLNFSNEEELLAFVVTELTKMAVTKTDLMLMDNAETRQISFSGFGPIINRIGQNLANRIQSCRAVVLNFFVRGCGKTTTTTTTEVTTTLGPSRN